MKEQDRLIREALRQGWIKLKQGRGAHIKLRSPEGRLVVLPASPSDRRGSYNLRADLRRAGLKI